MAPEEDRFEDLPQSLIERLKSVDQPVPMITARVDREVSQMARAHFSMRRRARLPRPAWAAMAASVLFMALIAYWQVSPESEEPVIYADIDGSGQIDIADVLALARSQKPGERSQAELDAFALRIVSLKPRGETT